MEWYAAPRTKAREELSQELMVLLHDSVPLVAITEGRDKNQAAQESARQIADFLAASSSSASHETIHLLFARRDHGRSRQKPGGTGISTADRRFSCSLFVLGESRDHPFAVR